MQQHASAGTMMFHQWQTAPAAAPKPEPTESTTQTPAGPQHIPRPPNAFILFRSSFIRSRSVPASLVPNHSALSKICGKIWNALPREEKKYWEEKAEEALKVHRERYPEWRWVAGGGAGGGGGKKRGRIKDGGGEEGRGRGKEKEKAPRKKATAKKSAKADVLGDTPSASGASEGGGGKDRAARRRAEKKREASADARCAKIAEMVADGAVGDELERAIEDWERVTGGSGSTSSANPGGDETPASPVSNPSQQSADQQKQQQEAQRTVRARRGTDASASSRASASSTTSRASTGASGALPLTAMFRRGTSSPASEGPASPPPPTPALPAAPMPAPVPVQQVPTLAPVPRTARRAGMHRPVPAPVVEERVPQMALEDRRTHRRTHTSQTSSGAGMPPPASLARPGGLMAFSGPAMARRHSIAAAGPPADVMGSGGMGAHIHGMGVGGLGAVQSAPPTPPGAWGWERVSVRLLSPFSLLCMLMHVWRGQTCLVGLPTCPSLAGDVCASCAFGFAGAGSPGPPAPALPGYAPQYAPYGAPPVRQQQQQPAQQQAAPVSTYSELFAWAGAPPEGAPAKRGKTGEVDAGRW